MRKKILSFLRVLWVMVWGTFLLLAFWKRDIHTIHQSWQGLAWGLLGIEALLLLRKERHLAFSSVVFLLWTAFIYLVYGKTGIGLQKSLFTHTNTYNLIGILTFSLLGVWIWRSLGVGKWLSRMGWRPYMVILLSFVVLIWIGTILLMFPFMHQKQQTLSLLDALFTATSAVCVTGLTVVDTSTTFSLPGQLVILGLIQTGGLGLMVFAGAFAFITGRGLSLQGGSTLKNALGAASFREVRQLVKSILLFTLLWELVGTSMLFLSFSKKLPWFEALYYSLFHSVSAFCNAGFSLFPDSLVGFRTDPVVILTIAFLIIFGGLGFVVMQNLWRVIRFRFTTFRQRHKKHWLKNPEITTLSEEGYLKLHSRVVLGMTAFLLVSGTIVFLLSEYHGELAALSPGEKLLNAFFASVTARTAGFNTIDYGRVQPITLFFTILLMFIGASPGSTGGGIKTTTLFLVLVNTYHVFRENLSLNVGRREVPFDNVRKAYLIFVISLLWITGALALLLVFQQDTLERLLFELISAFGTVGLSTGITSTLSPAAKGVIILTMFFGRVGPLALFYGIGISAKRSLVKYIQEDISVG